VVVDDGSTDETAAVARRAGADVLALPYNLGIGGAVQTGLKFAARKDYAFIIRVDGDGQHYVADIPRLLALVQRGVADVAIGSRFCPGEETYRPPLARRLGIRFFSRLISFLTGQPAYDPTSGMQCLNRRALRVLAQCYPQDYPEVEARILFHRAGLRVIETPAHMLPRPAGNSSITNVRAIYYMLKVTLATLITFLRRGPHTLQDGERAHVG
jgi:glycosyltransferase involved in cell wall biosynthesis